MTCYIVKSIIFHLLWQLIIFVKPLSALSVFLNYPTVHALNEAGDDDRLLLHQSATLLPPWRLMHSLYKNFLRLSSWRPRRENEGIIELKVDDTDKSNMYKEKNSSPVAMCDCDFRAETNEGKLSGAIITAAAKPLRSPYSLNCWLITMESQTDFKLIAWTMALTLITNLHFQKSRLKNG